MRSFVYTRSNKLMLYRETTYYIYYVKYVLRFILTNICYYPHKLTMHTLKKIRDFSTSEFKIQYNKNEIRAFATYILKLNALVNKRYRCIKRKLE